MFVLTAGELDNALAAITHHGYSIYLPPVPEWSAVEAHWGEIRDHLTTIDLDTYAARPCLRAYAPKSRINLRPVSLLHPFDVIIYTALTLLIRDDVERARLPVSAKRVFSHRSVPSGVGQLYDSQANAYAAYKQRLLRASAGKTVSVVATTDIADFFPRINHHRLQNVILTIATGPRQEAVGRVILKLLNRWSRGDSYGLPVGPLASSVLAEAVLIDVDTALHHSGYTFTRWVDDYTFFCRSQQEARAALFVLGEWLFEHHGLTLQVAKTAIFTSGSFRKGLANDYESRLRHRSEQLYSLYSRIWTPYGDVEVKLSPDDLRQIDAVNLTDMLKKALRPAQADYECASFILGRIAAVKNFPEYQKDKLLKVVLSRLSDLHPIIVSVVRFLSNVSALGLASRDRVSRAILKHLLSDNGRVPDFVSMWLLSVFSEGSEWNHAGRIRQLYASSRSEIVRRAALLALARTGSRADVLATRVDFDSASPLLRTALLLSWTLLGRDERKHWRQMAVLSDPLERHL